jgi:DNA polymerase zeta
MMQEDENAAPEYGERVPYVIYYGKPKSTIRDQAIHPLEMLKSKDLLLHGRYYIRKKIIPPLARIFNLIGADIMSWFDAMPKVKRSIKYGKEEGKAGKTIDFFFKGGKCVVCTVNDASVDGLCLDCASDLSGSMFKLESKKREAEREYTSIVDVCRSCMRHGGVGEEERKVDCESLDCPMLYERVKSGDKLEALMHRVGDGQLELF